MSATLYEVYLGDWEYAALAVCLKCKKVLHPYGGATAYRLLLFKHEHPLCLIKLLLRREYDWITLLPIKEERDVRPSGGDAVPPPPGLLEVVRRAWVEEKGHVEYVSDAVEEYLASCESPE